MSEAAFFENPDWLKIGFELLQWLATFSRDYLLPKLKSDFAVFEKKMAEYADVVARLGRYPPEDLDRRPLANPGGS